MLEIFKTIVTATVVSQGTDISLKVINGKTVTDQQVGGLIVAIAVFAFLNNDNN